MKLKSVSAVSFKGRSFKHEMSGVDLFLGSSFSGKTAVLDAVRVGLLGYHPKLGKRPSDTFALSSGDTMTVTLETDADAITHHWMSKGGGKVYHSGPDAPAVPAVLMDFRDYLDMPRADRRAYVFRRMVIDDSLCSLESVTAAIKSVKVESPNEDSEKAIAEAVQIVSDLHQARIDEDVSIQTWIETCVDSLREIQRTTRALAVQMAGTVQGVTQIKSGEQRQKLVSVEAELEAARQRRQALAVELGKLNELKQRNLEHAAKIAALEKSVAASKDYAVGIAILEADRNTFGNQLAEWDDERLVRATKALGEAHTKAVIAAGLVKRLDESLLALHAKHAEHMKLKCCPFCKSDKKGWRKAIEAEFKKEKQSLVTQLNAAMDAQKAADAAEREARNKLSDTDAAARRMAEVKTRYFDTSRKLEAARVESDRIKAAATELETLKANAPAPCDEARLKQLDAELVNVVASIVNLDQQQKRFIESVQADLQQAKAVKKHAEHKAKEQVFALAVEALREIQQKQVDAAIERLIGTARKFTDGIMPGTLAYRDGDIGYFAGSSWVSHEEFSGTEEAISYAGLAVALAADAPVRLVIIDELGIADSATKRKIVERMGELVRSGVIDQFVGADVADAGEWQGVNAKIHRIE